MGKRCGCCCLTAGTIRSQLPWGSTTTRAIVSVPQDHVHFRRDDPRRGLVWPLDADDYVKAALRLVHAALRGQLELRIQRRLLATNVQIRLVPEREVLATSWTLPVNWRGRGRQIVRTSCNSRDRSRLRAISLLRASEEPNVDVRGRDRRSHPFQRRLARMTQPAATRNADSTAARPVRDVAMVPFGVDSPIVGGRGSWVTRGVGAAALPR